MSYATIIGAGAWGTALATVLAHKNEEVVLWAREPEVVWSIQEHSENKMFLPGIVLPNNIHATSSLSVALQDTNLIMIAVPSRAFRSIVQNLCTIGLKPGVPIVSATKGIEVDSLQLMNEVLEQESPSQLHAQLAFLSGPSFANEVALKLPTAVTIASQNLTLAHALVERVSSTNFRAYGNNDVVGVEIGGALKNVIAIAAGAVDGLKLGNNARAALLTRSLAEITRLAIAKGAHARTMSGLSGIGDLILTCTNSTSRNYTLGYELAQGRQLNDFLSKKIQVVEGVLTAKSAYLLAQKLNVEMPIVNEVYAVLYEHKPIQQAVHDLLRRKLHDE